MQNLRKFVAPEIVFGSGALSLAARYAVNFGARNPMIVTDEGVAKAGWVDMLSNELSEEGLNPKIFAAVSQNPRDFQASEGASFYRENKCDVILALGGGSPMDCAKAVGILSTNERGVRDFEGVDNVEVPGPPLICIPTTAGTSADVSQFAIINNTDLRKKFAIISKTMVPDVALIDPDTTFTMDPYLTACTGMDALVHAVEAAVSTASSPITDLHAFEAIRLICAHLPLVMKDPKNAEHREKMMFASMQAGLAFSNASLGAVHAMAHSLGGLLDIPHGECNALLLRSVVEFNYSSAPERYMLVASAMNIPVDKLSSSGIASALAEKIESLREEVGITGSLSSRGMEEAFIAQLAENALSDPCMVTNPRIPVLTEIREVFRNAL
ncbi:MAG: iron-containing alcohol dehydrogenase [Spirochaetales bacterium]|nr:iron-containing alcohol dehydrogenase [Spirochaetales bacterium]